MARGSLAKENITKALLSIFPNSFVAADGKTIRIPTTCEGETIEVKCSLVAAKDLEGGQASFSAVSDQPIPQNTELTDEEIAEVKNLIAELNL